MNDMLLEAYWSELPKGRENAATYERLCSMWRRDKRTVRRILHELSAFDNGDNYILIRSSHGTGFYKTDDPKEIAEYRGFSLVIDRSSNSGIIYGSTKVDISNEVLQKLGYQ